jgi:hypothetical protein
MLDSRRASCENLLHILIIIYLGNSIPQSSNHKDSTNDPSRLLKRR